MRTTIIAAVLVALLPFALLLGFVVVGFGAASDLLRLGEVA